MVGRPSANARPFQPLQSTSRRPLACLYLYLDLFPPDKDSASGRELLYRRVVALAASRTMMGPPLSPWLPELDNQRGPAKSTRPRTSPYAEEPTSQRSSEQRRVRELLSEATRSRNLRIIAYANTYPQATHQAIADKFAVSTRTAGRALARKKEIDKKRQPIASQLERKKLASKSAQISSFTSSSGWTTNLPFDRTTTYTIGDNWQLPHHTTTSTSVHSVPDNSAAVPGKSSTGTSTTPVGPALSIHDSTTAELTKLPRSPWESLTNSVKIHLTDITLNKAYKALHIAIGYCRSKPKGYLTIEEGVLLGKLQQRLEQYCK